jgi:hypothetical protein
MHPVPIELATASTNKVPQFAVARHRGLYPEQVMYVIKIEPRSLS